MFGYFHKLLYANRYKRLIRAVIVTGVCIFISANARSADLIVLASGFKNSEGIAVAKLFRPGDNVRKHGYLEVSSEIHDGKAQMVFPSLSAANYAVVVYHDVNRNNEIDHNWMGLPSEGLGFSNNFTLSWRSGLPTFAKLRFTHNDELQTIMIEVKG